MRCKIEKMNETQAQIISKWRYEEPYSIYNMDDSPEDIEELCDGSYYSVLDDNSNVIGYYCFGKSAQVPVGNKFGVYESKNAVDIGLGMRPDLCGQGLGSDFLIEGMKFTERELSAVSFRLTVAAFNKRAIKAYEKVGFKKIAEFERILGNEKIDFHVMLHTRKEI